MAVNLEACLKTSTYLEKVGFDAAEKDPPKFGTMAVPSTFTVPVFLISTAQERAPRTAPREQLGVGLRAGPRPGQLAAPGGGEGGLLGLRQNPAPCLRRGREGQDRGPGDPLRRGERRREGGGG